MSGAERSRLDVEPRDRACRTREPDAPKDDAAAQLDAAALGERTFRLQQVYGPPAGWKDQKVVAKGLPDEGRQPRNASTSPRCDLLTDTISSCANWGNSAYEQGRLGRASSRG